MAGQRTQALTWQSARAGHIHMCDLMLYILAQILAIYLE